MPPLRHYDAPGAAESRPAEVYAGAETMSNYILEDGKPKATPDLMEWAKWFETAERRVEHTEVGGYEVSTVFLGIDHQFGDGPPLLFETMVFGCGLGDWDDHQRRYATLGEAKAGHFAIVQAIEAGKEPE